MRTPPGWPLAIPILLTFVSGEARAQTIGVQRGFDASVAWREVGGPLAMSACAPGLAGHVVIAVRDAVLDVDTLGFARPLHALGNGQSIGLLARLAGTAEICFTSQQTSTIWRRSLATSAQTGGPCVKNAFDLVRAPTGELLASANPDWPSPAAATGVWRVDPTLGQHKEIVRLSGPSGPLVIDAAGNLLVALLPTTVPPPAGSVRVLRFDAAKIQATLQGAPILHASDGVTVIAALDGCYDLAFDDRERLCLSDANHGGIQRTLAGGYVLDSTPLVARGMPSTLTIGFADASAATLDAYQPDDAGTLIVLATDWTTSGEAWRLRPQRAWLYTAPATSAPPGPFAAHVFDAEPNAALGLCVSFGPMLQERELLRLDGIPMFWELDLQAPAAWLATTVGNDGRARVDLVNPGGLATVIRLQSAFVLPMPSGLRCGTMRACALTLLP